MTKSHEPLLEAPHDRTTVYLLSSCVYSDNYRSFGRKLNNIHPPLLIFHFIFPRSTTTRDPKTKIIICEKDTSSIQIREVRSDLVDFLTTTATTRRQKSSINLDFLTTTPQDSKHLPGLTAKYLIFPKGKSRLLEDFNLVALLLSLVFQ
jgi:hypothetical protein